MDNTDLSHDEKRLILKNFNHRLNNDLQALLALIKIQRRFGIDDDKILNSSCVSIASISAIQNLMYDADNDENLVSVNDFVEDFIKILNEYYSKFNIGFLNEIQNDFIIKPKKVFHLMLLINEMINLSIDFSFESDSGNTISINIEKNEEKCLLTYSDNGSGIKETISESGMRTVLFEQLIKQINGTLESSNENNVIPIEFSYE